MNVSEYSESLRITMIIVLLKMLHQNCSAARILALTELGVASATAKGANNHTNWSQPNTHHGSGNRGCIPIATLYSHCIWGKVREDNRDAGNPMKSIIFSDPVTKSEPVPCL